MVDDHIFGSKNIMIQSLSLHEESITFCEGQTHKS